MLNKIVKMYKMVCWNVISESLFIVDKKGNGKTPGMMNVHNIPTIWNIPHQHTTQWKI